MYDVVFIDDKADEIQDTIAYMQSKHVRCYYSTGVDNNLTNRDQLPFINLQYICSDLYLLNRGMVFGSNLNNLYSTLAGVISTFVVNPQVEIIINTGYDVSQKNFNFDNQKFFEYLEQKVCISVQDVKLRIEQKNIIEVGKKFSVLHENEEIMNSILRQSTYYCMRNLVIREAIEVENLIWEVITSNSNALMEVNNEFTDELRKVIRGFQSKIELYKSMSCEANHLDVVTRIRRLQKIRNNYAHKDIDWLEQSIDAETREICQNVCVFLEFVENIKSEIRDRWHI